MQLFKKKLQDYEDTWAIINLVPDQPWKIDSGNCGSTDEDVGRAAGGELISMLGGVETRMDARELYVVRWRKKARSRLQSQTDTSYPKV